MRTESDGTGIPACGRSSSDERGVALIIVLLVTALLIALVFEFAYATRISLRAAVNYRDSERAYYLARSGVNVAGRYLAYNLKTDATGSNHKYERLEQKEWQPVPFQAGADASVVVRWDDESAKIRITDVQVNRIRQNMLRSLFEVQKGIDTTVLDRMMENTSTVSRLKLLTGLHQYMTDEDYKKVFRLLTVVPVINNVNINTASEDVLMSMGISSSAASLIINDRQKAPITDLTNYAPLSNVMIEGSKVTNFMTDSSDIFTVYSSATVGGYEKTVQAVIQRNAGGTFTVLNNYYWTVLDPGSVL